MAAKKEKKKKGEDGGNSIGGVIGLVFITILIILIWLAIFVLLIKMDVGGFGSDVLYPVLKDVPYVNKILPGTIEDSTEETNEQKYQTLTQAINRINELELSLAITTAENNEMEQTIADLTAEIALLEEYKREQAAFEIEKEKFYEEVVFSDEAPDIEEYRAYYESIDPENAAVLYKQVVEQSSYNQDMKNYVATYSSMKPKEAAAIFDSMTDDLGLVAEILKNMDPQSRADILGKMSTDIAAKVTEILEPSN